MVFPITAQETILSMDKAIKLALERNPTIQAAALETSRQYTLRKACIDIPKTEVMLTSGQYNSIRKNDNHIAVSQGIPFPSFFYAQRALNKALITSAKFKEAVVRNELILEIKQTFNQLLYLKARQRTLLRHDSLLTDLANINTLLYTTGEGTLLAKTAGDTQLLEIKNLVARNQSDVNTTLNRLEMLCQFSPIRDVEGYLETLVAPDEINTSALSESPSLAFALQQVEVSRRRQKEEVSRMLPDLRVGYFSQTLIGSQNINGRDEFFGSGKRFYGFQVGISVPLYMVSHSAKIKAASLATDAAQKQSDAFHLTLAQQYNEAIQELYKNKASVNYYKESALPTAAHLTSQSNKAYQSGELSYANHIMNLRQALSVAEGYLLAFQQYNQSIIIIEFLNGN
ncbi:TolC family protein [Ohtaekwangia koreensis]|uniref:TolC family protein n=1 Tax=Ohtaekwangia koreensis TaxID=688867 RepID=UPI0013562E6E|nr:TolC family protein [Ohtaekwangia koreensis]